MSGSKGLQRYVPRILQDSGMIASSEVAHYTHLKLVQYVKADDIDAALRRAKADGVREASGAAKKLANGVVPTAAMNALNLLGVELDARAAQIENEAIK